MDRVAPRVPAWVRVALRLAVPAATVAVGGYLLMWAREWPHSDMRNVWATAVGLGVVVVGAVASAVVLKRPGWPAVTALLMSIATLAVGVFALESLTDGQRRACGGQLAACESLLPPFSHWWASSEPRIRPCRAPSTDPERVPPRCRAQPAGEKAVG